MSDNLAWFIGRRFFSAGSSSRLASFISLLAMTGLVMGVSLLIIVLSVMNGFDREMRTRILGLVPHIQLYQAGGIENWQALEAEIRRIPGVEEVTPFTRLTAMISYRGKIEAADIQGFDPDYLDTNLRAILPPEFQRALVKDGIILSQILAEKLGIEEGGRLTIIVPRVGDRGEQLAPEARSLRVAAVFNTHTAEDNALALVHITTAGGVTGFIERPQGLRIRINDVFQARELGYYLIRNLPPTFSFVDWFQTHGNLYQAIKMSRQLVGLLIFLIIAIAVFNVVSMLVMTVVDKKPGVAILKTLGATNPAILGVFFVQGSLIGLWGCLLGVLLGVPAAIYISDAVKWIETLFGIRFLNSEIYPIDYLPTDLQVQDVVTIVAVALGLNFLATLYPAWKAARIRPAEILRYE